MNTLWYGDCLTVMQGMKAGSVDLIYLDPPFNSKKNYHSIYEDETGRPLPDQVEAFCDMWTMTPEREREIRAMPILVAETGIDDSTVEFWKYWLNALRKTNERLLAYLVYMVVRLAHMRVLLKPTGSLYLHCDPTASHYIKVMMDGIFGQRNFLNEIIWKRTHAHGSPKRFGPVHDVILCYAKSEAYLWTFPQMEQEGDYFSAHFTHSEPGGKRFQPITLTGSGVRHGESGKPWRDTDPTEVGRHWAIPRRITSGLGISGKTVQDRLDALDKAGRIYWPDKKDGTPRLKWYTTDAPTKAVPDVWVDIDPIPARANERLGYPTQKPLKLLKRIIRASSNPGDVVMDPFCGCATTLEAAHTLNRRWIGIDIAIHAIKRVARLRLTDRCGLVEGTDFEVRGVPRNLEGARDLWKRDKYHFQKWAVEQVEGFVTNRQTADGGVDGRLYFAVPDERDLQSMVIEVKGGANVNITDVRALGDVLQRDSALLAGLIVMDELGPVKNRNFVKLMAEAGDLDVLGVKYPRMQMLTAGQILAGERFATPSVAARHTMAPHLPGTR